VRLFLDSMASFQDPCEGNTSCLMV
jgi:hypothetical protein